ncbi:UNVERIFIED_CONTAM: hypothetical protein GTU68_048374 [Idotea baltica]|nr:hypothetical protein [Idotea baltica]
MKNILLLFIVIFTLASCAAKKEAAAISQLYQSILASTHSESERQIVEYLIKNKLRAQKTKQGVYYIIKNEGDGANPTKADNITCHYKGSLLDDTVFDSSYERDEPVTFPLSRLIEGWQIGLPLIKAGGAIQLFIPPNLGYGERAAGKIPGNSVLIFDMELFEVTN